MCKIHMDPGDGKKTTWWVGPQVLNMGDRNPGNNIRIGGLELDILELKEVIESKNRILEEIKTRVVRLEVIPNKTQEQLDELTYYVERRGVKTQEIVTLEGQLEAKQEELGSLTGNPFEPDAPQEAENASNSNSD